MGGSHSGGEGARRFKDIRVAELQRQGGCRAAYLRTLGRRAQMAKNGARDVQGMKRPDRDLAGTTPMVKSTGRFEERPGCRVAALGIL